MTDVRLVHSNIGVSSRTWEGRGLGLTTLTTLVSHTARRTHMGKRLPHRYTIDGYYGF